ncbi:hypothetical protein LCGC14_0167030 [marine sediment metagenome]|uniref:DSBA-like thioredoxin domain-containing protein n=1 Tax=marine sediment metagenome TaxID=412755 RepID=A0A0F9UTK0_9ZZZZ|nr:DsbA family protein [Halomonas sp.]HDZ45843.1 DsbA family protein [Halomonas sp.]HEB28358.1 DsbA family protein [Porticoccus sp.]
MTHTLYYLFDPLCGCCYGATSAVKEVIAADDVNVVLLPSGLFSDSGGRQMDSEFAAYAWSNDQCIERLTGQIFTQLYRSQVLGDDRQRLDSSAATLALTAVAITAPAQEFDTLKAIQYARYVQGRDVTSQATLVELLQSLGLSQAAELVLETNDQLVDANRARLSKAQALMQEFDARGVPSFIVQQGDTRRSISTNEIYTTPSALIHKVFTP